MRERGRTSNVRFGPEQRPWCKLVPEGAVVSPPEENPIAVYPAVPPAGAGADRPTLDYRNFELPPEGLTARQRLVALAELQEFVRAQHVNFTGFQVNEDLDYQELSWLLDIHTNNVGDPFSSGYMTLNTKLVERAVLDYFAALWNAKWPHLDQDNSASEPEATERYWGYVLSMGSTEGNLYATYNARNYLNGSMLLHAEDDRAHTERLLRGKRAPLGRRLAVLPDGAGAAQWTPVAFYSEDTHYSVVKAMNVMQVRTFHDLAMELGLECPLDEYRKQGTWPTEVPSHDYQDEPESGSIDIDDLFTLMTPFLERGYPPLIVLNVGSTWKGAYDKVDEVNAKLLELYAKYEWLGGREVTCQDPKTGEVFTETRRGCWVHVDGALGGAYLPFFEMAYNRERIDDRVPVFDFRNETVSSICCSMHKWIGGPWPGGVYMTKRKYQLNPPATDGYIGSPDTTLGGSRNAVSPVLLWSYFARNGYEENMEKALECESAADKLEKGLRSLESHIRRTDPDADLWIHRSRLSLAVSFRMVNPEIAYKFTVDCERLTVPLDDKKCEDRSYAHCYAMQSLGAFDVVEALLADIREVVDSQGWKAAFPEAKNRTIDGYANPARQRPIER